MRIDHKRVAKAREKVGGFGRSVWEFGQGLGQKIDEYEKEAPQRRKERIRELEHQIKEERLKQKLNKLKGNDKGFDFI